MSLHVGSYVELWIGAQQISARLVHRRWLRSSVFDSAISLALGDDDDLSAAVVHLIVQLDSIQPSRTIRVIVSDCYCRYLLLPRPVGARNRAELQASIEARFQASFGDTLADWILQTDSAPAAQHDLVCALRRSVADSVHQAADKLAKRLLSMQPLWIWCAGQTERPPHQINKRNTHWLLSAESNSVTAGLFRAGRCIGVRSSRHISPGENIEHILMRESALYEAGEEGGDDAAQVTLFAHALTQGGSASAAGFKLIQQQLPASWVEDRPHVSFVQTSLGDE